MTASMNADSDLELFREDIEAAKRDVASLIEHMKGVARTRFRTSPAKLNSV